MSERTGADGCWIIASLPLGKLSSTSVFWTLDVYPTKQMAQAASSSNSTIVESLGRIWLFTVGDKIKPSLALR